MGQQDIHPFRPCALRQRSKRREQPLSTDAVGSDPAGTGQNARPPFCTQCPAYVLVYPAKKRHLHNGCAAADERVAPKPDEWIFSPGSHPILPSDLIIQGTMMNKYT